MPRPVECGDCFLAIMDRVMPSWRVSREELNQSPLAHQEWSSRAEIEDGLSRAGGTRTPRQRRGGTSRRWLVPTTRGKQTRLETEIPTFVRSPLSV
jgi:hypothetical protein